MEIVIKNIPMQPEEGQRSEIEAEIGFAREEPWISILCDGSYAWHIHVEIKNDNVVLVSRQHGAKEGTELRTSLFSVIIPNYDEIDLTDHPINRE